MNKISGIKCKSFKKNINYRKYPLYEFDNLIDCETKILENSYRAINIAFIDGGHVSHLKIMLS